jgi:competence protein ComEC
MTRAIAVLVALLLSVISAERAAADYLRVVTSATIKDRPSGAGAVLDRPSIGTELVLLEEGKQTNGYYRVMLGEEPGWIYRTLVRRFPGNLSSTTSAAARSDVAVVGPLTSDLMRVHYIDVGQGNAALLEFSCGVVLIDAGGQNQETTERLIQYLERVFDARPDLDRTINTVFITHTHIDHNRALRRVVENFAVKNYVHDGVLTGSGKTGANWMQQHANDNGRQIKMRKVEHRDIAARPRKEALTDSSIDPVDCAGTDPAIRVLHGPYEENPGWPDSAYENENNNSLVIRIDFGKASFLFTGDLEEEAIETMVGYFEGTRMLDADVYLVGHHGSHNGTTDSLLQAMTPKHAIISMGPSSDQSPWTAWAYGHPRRPIVDLLNRWTERSPFGPRQANVALGVRKFAPYTVSGSVYATGWDGTVVVAANQNGQFAIRTIAPTPAQSAAADSRRLRL